MRHIHMFTLVMHIGTRMELHFKLSRNLAVSFSLSTLLPICEQEKIPDVFGHMPVDGCTPPWNDLIFPFEIVP